MKYIIATVLCAVCAGAYADTISVPLNTPSVEVVSRAEISFHVPPLEVSRPWINPQDGRFGRVLRASALSVRLYNQNDEPFSYWRMNPFLTSDGSTHSDIYITGQQLDAPDIGLKPSPYTIRPEPAFITAATNTIGGRLR